MTYEFSTSDFDDTDPGGSTEGMFDYSSFTNPDNFESNDAFLTSIGINPSKTYSFPNSDSPSNAQILNDINYIDPGFLGSLNKLLGTNLNSSDLAKLAVGAGGIAGLMGATSGKSTPTGYQGKIPSLVANRQMVTAPISSKVVDGKTVPVRPGAGGTKYGGDVVYTNAEQPTIKAASGKYLRGPTDGMADELPAQIGENQPAALSHGEFVIPADVVSHLGNGNSDAGAKKLYQMMDKVRQARTGNKKQGKKINPDKYMPGGIVNLASGGNVKKFNSGGTTAPKSPALPADITGKESSLSNWAGDYVTDMLGKGQALSNMPYEQYSGPLTAGASPLQTQAFDAFSKLKSPAGIGEAAGAAGNIAKKASALKTYSPTSFTNQFTAPTASQAINFTNQYKAPTAYSPTTSEFDAAQLQKYLNPYLEASLNPQLEEARRQAQITQAQNASKMTQAGAFGGGRQAILDAETQRNLGTNLANITGQGYNTAFTNAQQQFNADQTRRMQEAQFGATQGMTAAQLQAQYGLSAQQANEAARQFGATQNMTAAQLKAQYGAEAQRAAEQSRQYGADYGLKGLQTGLQAAQTQSAISTAQNQADLANLAAMFGAGTTQRGIEAEGIAADKAAFEEARLNPFKMIQFQQSLLQGMPLEAQSYNTSTPSKLVSGAQGATTVAELLKTLGIT